METYHGFVGVEFWFPPFRPDENIGIKLFLEGVDLTQLQEGHVNDHLTLKSKCACVLSESWFKIDDNEETT